MTVFSNTRHCPSKAPFGTPFIYDLLSFSAFAPPAQVRCEDDKDFQEEFCPKFKEKKFCESKVEIMELACAKTCELCPSGEIFLFQLPGDRLRGISETVNCRIK